MTAPIKRSQSSQHLATTPAADAVKAPANSRLAAKLDRLVFAAPLPQRFLD